VRRTTCLPEAWNFFDLAVKESVFCSMLQRSVAPIKQKKLDLSLAALIHRDENYFLASFATFDFLLFLLLHQLRLLPFNLWYRHFTSVFAASFLSVFLSLAFGNSFLASPLAGSPTLTIYTLCRVGAAACDGAAVVAAGLIAAVALANILQRLRGPIPLTFVRSSTDLKGPFWVR